MIPIQEVDIHTDKKVFYKLHLVAPTGAAPFSTEVLVYDSEFNPPFISRVTFHHQFQDSKAAFAHGLSWVEGYSKKHGYTVNRINNPCNCEFLSQADQQQSVQSVGLKIWVQVNGA
ncbi:hypothetical protein EGD00_02690 [Pectobacterium carotovorum subsp. carotovorum]|nr:hypothetical protein EGD00_02690 [Pectobacterium carotovorum subsp. carotovorum]